MERGAWWPTVHGVQKSRTQMSTHTQFPFYTLILLLKYPVTPVQVKVEFGLHWTLIYFNTIFIIKKKKTVSKLDGVGENGYSHYKNKARPVSYTTHKNQPEMG